VLDQAPLLGGGVDQEIGVGLVEIVPSDAVDALRGRPERAIDPRALERGVGEDEERAGQGSLRSRRPSI